MNPDSKNPRRRRLGLITLGCPKNTVDSERLLGELEVLGWRFAETIDDADCLIVNTCGFIRDARLESEEAIEEMRQVKLARPEVILVVTGCLPQRDEIDLRSRFPEADLIVGVGDLEKLPSLLESALRGEKPGGEAQEELCRPGRATLSGADSPRLMLTPPWSAYMKIAEGCDHSCAFCTIPHIKGPYRSRPVPDLVEETRFHAANGVKELIIISQDTTAYGSDIGTNLRTLLKEIDRIDGIVWIRLHYLYPSKVSQGLLDVIAESRRIIPYFDIPIQHVRPEILRAMDRLAPETNALDLIETIRARFRNSPTPACIRSTLIVGYPGETGEDIGAILDFLERARIDRLTVFEFSPEEGTAAHELPDRVPEGVSERRLHLVMEAQHDISLEINEEWVGRSIDVLLEGETDDGCRAGRSYRDAPEIDGLVLVTGVPDSVEDGAIVRARVTGALPYDLEAEWYGDEP